jgi:hypothetical protein
MSGRSAVDPIMHEPNAPLSLRPTRDEAAAAELSGGPQGRLSLGLFLVTALTVSAAPRTAID